MEKENMEKFLESYTEKRMYTNEQDVFRKEFFSMIFGSSCKNYQNRGVISINAILREMDSNYRITSWANKNKNISDSVCWMVICIDKDYNKNIFG